MKTAFLSVLAVASLSSAAHAAVTCEAIKLEQPGKTTLRGVRVMVDGKIHVQEHLFGDERAAVYFGGDSAERDRVGSLCQEIIRSSRCEARTPRVEDQYVNRGDPGFGPALWQKDSTKAATLQVEPVSKSTEAHIGDSLSSIDGRYFKYYSECERARADIAYELLKSAKRQFDIKNAPPAEPGHFEGPHIYDKF